MKHTYKFITLPVQIGAKQSKHPNHPSYQDVINEHARQGWRFVQLLIECPAAVPTEYVLVFEQPLERLEHDAQEGSKPA